ncbi:MAG: T9SS C-terminal target domain-containing protein [Ignavibacteriae bacterium]|nr:MAG: T9SS C-terminal target domain-containing protein [Ignavibacteriota bacterium]
MAIIKFINLTILYFLLPAITDISLYAQTVTETRTANGGANTAALIFAGSANQTITLPANGAVFGNITIDKSAGRNTITLAGGDLICNGIVKFNNGLIKTGTDNALVLTNISGDTGLGFIHSVAAGNRSHVVGNVRQNLKYSIITEYARNEFPVGDTVNYRPAALTFHTPLSTTSGKYGIFATVSHSNTRPTGTAGFPLVDAIAYGTPINGYPSFYWSIKIDSTLGLTPYDLELTAAGALPSEVYLGDVSSNRVKIIRRRGTNLDMEYIWNLQGNKDSYDNRVTGDMPTVIALNSKGGLSKVGSIFTYGYGGICPCFYIYVHVIYGNSSKGIENTSVTLIPLSGSTMTAVSNIYGDFYFSNFNYSDYENIMRGNYTGSAAKYGGWGGVTGADALIVSRHIAGISLLDGLPLIVADVNNSGSIDGADVVSIVRRAVGFDNAFIAGDWKFEFQTDTITNASNKLISISGMCVGDVNASYGLSSNSSFAKNSAFVKLTGGEVTRVNLNNTCEFPVRTLSPMAIGAVTLRINFPSHLVSYEGISTKLDGLMSRVEDGAITVGWVDTSGRHAAQFNANEELFRLKFTTKSQQGTCAIALDTLSEFVDAEGTPIASVNLAAPTVEIGNIPSTVALLQNYPNPFNPSTTINYELPSSSVVRLIVCDILGREVAILENNQKDAGYYSTTFNGEKLSSGVYFARMTIQPIEPSSGLNRSTVKVIKLILSK